MLDELLKSALTLVIGFGLKWIFAQIGVEIEPALFDTIVAAFVMYFLTLFGYEAARKIAPARFRAK